MPDAGWTVQDAGAVQRVSLAWDGALGTPGLAEEAIEGIAGAASFGAV
jgi:hypothetical protein